MENISLYEKNINKTVKWQLKEMKCFSVSQLKDILTLSLDILGVVLIDSSDVLWGLGAGGAGF